MNVVRHTSVGRSFADTSFPTPMEEPKKILKCHYLGTIETAAPTSVDVLNGAMEKVDARMAPEKWVYGQVAVAPSTITITEHSVRERVAARVLTLLCSC